MPIDVFSSGNHIWDKREIYDTLNSSDRLLRPANYPPGNPGRGSHGPDDGGGHPRRRPEPPGAGLHAGERGLSLPRRGRGAREDRRQGRSSWTSTRRRPPRRWRWAGISTAASPPSSARTRTCRRRTRRFGRAARRYLSDAGMTGAYEGVIGFSKDRIIEKFLSQTPAHLRDREEGHPPLGRRRRSRRRTTRRAGKARRIERVQVRVVTRTAIWDG